MKIVTGIEMADNFNIYDVSFRGFLEIFEDPDEPVWYRIRNHEGEEQGNGFVTRKAARQYMIEYAVDEDLVITGYGKHSGRKFWQLPEELQSKIIGIARRAV